MWCQGPIHASKIDTISRTGSPMPDAGKTTTERKIDAFRSCLEASSTTTIHGPSRPNTPPEYVISSERCMSSNSLYVSLKKGQPIWQEISSTSHSFHVRTPRIHLTISQEEPFFGPLFQEISHHLVGGSDHYWLILEYLSDCIAWKDRYVPSVNLLDVPYGCEMILDYGTGEWPRRLLIYSKDDIISITYSVKGMELRV